MKRYISVLMAICMVFLMPVGAQARKLKSTEPPTTRGVAADGITVKGEKIQFYGYEPLDGKVNIQLPNLYDVPQEILDQMVPYEIQPQFVAHREDDYNIHVSLTYYEDIPMDEKGLAEFMETQKKQRKRLNPATVFYDTRTEKLETTVCWMDLQGHNAAGPTYELCAFFVVDGKLATIFFQCPFKFKSEWEPIAQTALPTIKVIPVEYR